MSEQNFAFMVQEMRRWVYKGVDGIHWDEMILKEEIVLFKRTGELAGFEDLTIDSDLNVGPNNLQNEDDESTTESNDSDTGPTDSDSDTDELFSNGESANKSKKAKLIRQFSIHQ